MAIQAESAPSRPVSKNLEQLKQTFAPMDVSAAEEYIKNKNKPLPQVQEQVTAAAPQVEDTTEPAGGFSDVATEQPQAAPIAQPTQAAIAPAMQAPNFQGITQDYEQKATGLMGEMEKTLADAEIERAKIQEEKKAKMEPIKQRIEALDKEIAGKKIESPDIWGNASTGQKIVLALGALFSSADPNAANAFRKNIDDAINRDLALQEKNLNEKKAQRTAALGSLDALKQEFGDIEQAKLAKASSYYKLLGDKMQYLAGITESKVKAAQFTQAAQVAMQEAELKRQELFQKQGQMAQATDPMTAKILSMPENMRKDLLKAKEVYDSTKAAEDSIRKSFEETKDIGVGSLVPMSDWRATVNANNAKIESSARNTMRGQGAIQEAEIVRLINPYLIDWNDTDSIRKIKQKKIIELIKEKTAGEVGRLKSLGLIESAEQKYGAKPK